MEKEAAVSFLENIKADHKNPRLKECGLFLDKYSPFIGARPDRIILCKCCVEIKGPYSINYTSPNDPSISLPYIKADNSLNPKHFFCCLDNTWPFTE